MIEELTKNLNLLIWLLFTTIWLVVFLKYYNRLNGIKISHTILNKKTIKLLLFREKEYIFPNGEYFILIDNQELAYHHMGDTTVGINLTIKRKKIADIIVFNNKRQKVGNRRIDLSKDKVVIIDVIE